MADLIKRAKDAYQKRVGEEAEAREERILALCDRAVLDYQRILQVALDHRPTVDIDYKPGTSLLRIWLHIQEGLTLGWVPDKLPRSVNLARGYLADTHKAQPGILFLRGCCHRCGELVNSSQSIYSLSCLGELLAHPFEPGSHNCSGEAGRRPQRDEQGNLS